MTISTNAKITKFSRPINNGIWEFILNTTTGYFEATRVDDGRKDPEAVYGILDMLISETRFQIKEIEIPAGRQLGAKPIVLSIGTQFQCTGIDGAWIVTSFKSIKNKIAIVGVLNGVNREFSVLENITEYVAPPVVKAELNNGKRNNFKEIQLKIEADMKPLKLNGYTHKDQNLVEFLKNFITKYNNEHDTVYAGNGHTQTQAGLRRSLGDIYMICKQYFPDCNLHDVIEALYTELPKIYRGLGSLMCRRINKRIWYHYGTPRFSHGDEKDEHGFNEAWYRDELKKVTEEPTVIKSNAILDQVRTKFKPGTKVKSMVGNGTFKIDSDEFFDGLRFIIAIQKDGSRKIVYNKNAKEFAKIVD